MFGFILLSGDAHGEGVDALGEAFEFRLESDQEIAREGDGKAEVRDDVCDVFHDVSFPWYEKGAYSYAPFLCDEYHAPLCAVTSVLRVRSS